MNRGSSVVTHLADVSRPQAPLLARNYRASDLAAGQHIRGTKLNLGSERRIARQANQCIGSVESDTDKINLKGSVHNGFS